MEYPEWIYKLEKASAEEIIEVSKKADCDLRTAYSFIKGAKETNPDEWRKYAIWRAFITTHTEYMYGEVFGADVDNEKEWPPYHSTF